MPTADYDVWDAAGRHWVAATPIAELEAWAIRNGFTVLGTIGDHDHLTDDEPEDHTPFSFTAWPLPLPGYIVCAIDIADERDLGAAILRSARAGSFPWLKYINVGQQHYHCRDGFQSSVFNSDTHNHLSIRTDWIQRTIGEFDPFGDADMGLNFNERAMLNAIINFSPTMTLDVETPSQDGTGAHQEFPVPFVAEIEKLAAGLSALKLSSVDIEALAEALRPHIQAAAEAAVLKVFSDQNRAQ